MFVHGQQWFVALMGCPVVKVTAQVLMLLHKRFGFGQLLGPFTLLSEKPLCMLPLCISNLALWARW